MATRSASASASALPPCLLRVPIGFVDVACTCRRPLDGVVEGGSGRIRVTQLSGCEMGYSGWDGGGVSCHFRRGI